MVFKTENNFPGGVILSEGFVREDMAELREFELKLYLLINAFAKSKTKTDIPAVSEMLKTTPDVILESMKGLEKRKLIKFTSSAVTVLEIKAENNDKPATLKEYTPEEIAEIKDKNLDEITSFAEKKYGKLLSYKEISVLVGLYHYLGISKEVLMIMIEYTGALGKKTMNYLRTTALSWHENKIDTPKKAHEYITYLEERKTYHEDMKAMLGIYGRNLTKKEAEFLDSWKDKFTAEEIAEAYETAVDMTGKISFSYMNKVLNSDGESKLNIKKIFTKPKNNVKATRFNNINPSNTDYEAVKAKRREALKNRFKTN